MFFRRLSNREDGRVEWNPAFALTLPNSNFPRHFLAAWKLQQRGVSLRACAARESAHAFEICFDLLSSNFEDEAELSK